MRELTIKELASNLQKRIDSRLRSFNESHERLKALHVQAEELEKKMAEAVIELEPVESLIYNQNPQLEKLFESLKRIYGKEQDGVNKESN